MSAVATKRRRRVKAKNVRVGDVVQTDGDRLCVTQAVRVRDGYCVRLKEQTFDGERMRGVRGAEFPPDVFLTLIER